jgi:hypothetical protein
MTAAILLLATPAIAKPPPGTDLKSAEHMWWECHVQPVTKVVCCRESDGHVLNDDEWRAIERPDGTRHYQVRVDHRWYDVPPQVVVNDVRNCGPEPDRAKRPMAKIWYAPIWQIDTITKIDIYCFMGGTMY